MRETILCRVLGLVLLGALALSSEVLADPQVTPPAEAVPPLEDSLTSEKKISSPPLEPATPNASTLEWWNREITTFRSTTTQLNPEARSADALKKFEESSELLLHDDVSAEETEIEDEAAVRFHIGEEYLFSLLSSDLDKLAGRSLDDEKKEILSKMSEIRQARIEQWSAETIAKAITKAVIATAILVASIFLLRFVSSRISSYIEQKIRSLRRLRLARTDLRPHIGLLGKQFIRLSFFALGFYLFCAWVAFTFNQFPLTKPLGSAFTEHLKAFGSGILSKILEAVPGVATAVIILFATRWLARLVDRVVRSMGDDSDQGLMVGDTAKATRRISVACIWIVGLVLAYPYLPGSGSEAFKGISVLLGLMVSLGSSGMINQVMSGFVLLYSGSVRTGEYIKIGEIEGTITEMGTLAVKVLTGTGEFMIIPNAVMISNPTTNYSRLKSDTGVPITSVVTIGYDAPWRKVHELLITAAEKTAGATSGHEPKVLQKALSDWYAEYTLVIYAAEPQGRNKILSELNGHIQDAFNEAGIQIMSPHYERDPPEPMVIPKDRWFLPQKQTKASDT